MYFCLSFCCSNEIFLVVYVNLFYRFHHHQQQHDSAALILLGLNSYSYCFCYRLSSLLLLLLLAVIFFLPITISNTIFQLGGWLLLTNNFPFLYHMKTSIEYKWAKLLVSVVGFGLSFHCLSLSCSPPLFHSCLLRSRFLAVGIAHSSRSSNNNRWTFRIFQYPFLISFQSEKLKLTRTFFRFLCHVF